MALYIVSCALRDAAHDYGPLWKALEETGARRAMEAVWLLPTDLPLEKVTAVVLPYLKPTDRLFVGEVGRWSATHLLDDTGHWLKGIYP